MHQRDIAHMGGCCGSFRRIVPGYLRLRRLPTAVLMLPTKPVGDFRFQWVRFYS